jgi:5-methylthioadenosine/S-adenosylhomocysteine deaminase
MDADIGSIEVGKRADLILVETGELDQAGAMDPLFVASMLVIGRDVRTVLVNGQVVMKNREILTVDVDEIQHRLRRRRPEIMARFDAAVA